MILIYSKILETPKINKIPYLINLLPEKLVASYKNKIKSNIFPTYDMVNSIKKGDHKYKLALNRYNLLYRSILGKFLLFQGLNIINSHKDTLMPFENLLNLGQKTITKWSLCQKSTWNKHKKNTINSLDTKDFQANTNSINSDTLYIYILESNIYSNNDLINYKKEFPYDIAFNQYKKPYLQYKSTSLKDTQLNTLPYFNISHSNEYIVCIISFNYEVGIDIEKIRPIKSNIKNFLSKEDNNILQNHKDSKYAFFQLWTKKEALLKAYGTGIIPFLFKDLNVKVTTNIDIQEVNINKKKIYVKEVDLSNEYICNIAFKARL